MSEAEVDARRARLRELFAEMIGAFGRKDFNAFGQFLTEDTVFEWPYLPLKEFPERIIGGRKFIAASKEGMANAHPYNHQVDQFYDLLEPDMLIVEYHCDTTLIKSGERYANRYLGILAFEDEKVTFWKEYINPLPVLEVYGNDFANEAALYEASL